MRVLFKGGYYSRACTNCRITVIEIHNFVKKEENERVSGSADERTLKKGSQKGSKMVRSATKG